MTTHQLEITVRSPLHIGSGGSPLRNGVDFASFGRFLYVFDTDAVFDYILPDTGDQELIDKIMRSNNLASFLTQADVTQHPELFRYRLGGTSSLGEVWPQIKDAMGRLYLPGSTIKGALRTAIGTGIALRREITIRAGELGQRREWAARQVEQNLFGRAPRPAQAPNYDLMRTIQVTDSQPVAPDALELDNVAVWPAGERGIPIDIEAVRPGTTFTARLRLDDFLLGPAAQSLDFGRGVEAIRDWAGICQEHGVERIRQEALFFEGRAPEVERLYASLLQEAEEREPQTFFTQLGWGTGWNSKTLSRIIKPNRELLAQIIRTYGLVRGNYEQGGAFPKTRHVVADRGRPLAPLGWVKVRVA